MMPAATAPPDVAVPDGPLLHEGETSTNDLEMEASRRTSSRHTLIGALACGTIALGLGAFCLRYLIRHDSWQILGVSHAPVLPQLAGYGLGTAAVIGLFACIMAWSWRDDRAPQSYGPEPPPEPMTRGRWVLHAVGSWLLMLPFSGMCVAFAYVSVDSAVRESWKDAAVSLGVAIFFGWLGWLLIAGSGVAARPGSALTTGEPVPAAVRKSRWWRRVLWVLFFWCLFTTYGAISSGIQGQGGDSVGYAATAFGSWVALFVALSGKTPDDMFGS
jgi:hypothetical protein